MWHIHDIFDGRPWKNRLLGLIVARGSDTVVCVSEAVRRNLGAAADKARVVWNGIQPISAPTPSRPERAHQVVMLGRFNRLKGQSDLVNAASVLANGPLKDIPFHVRLVGGAYRGRDHYLQATARLINELGLESIVSIEDCVRNVSDVYATATLVVVPSPRPDPFPTVALEAMSAGVPVVAYASGGLPEMLAFDDEVLAPAGDHAALARRIGRMLLDDSFRHDKARAQHQRYVQNFTSEHYARRLRDALATAVQPAAGAVSAQRPV